MPEQSSLIDLANYRISPLTATNWEDWSARAAAIFILKGIWKHIDPEQERVRRLETVFQHSDRIDGHDKREDVAVGMLVLMISPSVLEGLFKRVGGKNRFWKMFAVEIWIELEMMMDENTNGYPQWYGGIGGRLTE